MQPDDRSEFPPSPVPHKLEELASGDYAHGNNYDEILRSSVLIGGSSVISTLIALVRTKVLAVLLGPAGFGLISVFSSIADVTRSFAEMGINNSGVRQIAEAVGSGDDHRIARTVKVLRRVSIVLGIFGAIILLVIAEPVSILTFGDDKKSGAIALLSLAVMFRLIADGQGAVIQGMRRISDLAKMGVLGALFGTVVSIPLVYFLHENGVVPFLISVAAMSVAMSWWYSRKIQIQLVPMNATQVRHEVSSLLALGLAFMAQLFLMMGAAYVTRLLLVRKIGIDAAGLYQSAWTLGGLYCAYIYQGIFADFYPRLVGLSTDNQQCNRLVNEQTHVAMLLVGPGVLVTITFAAEIIALLYSAEFSAATEILRWICLGATLRVIFQPMGFIVVAKGKRAIFFGSELVWTIVSLGLTWYFVTTVGLNGAGIAFFISFLLYGFMMYPIVRRLCGFTWAKVNWKVGSAYFIVIGAVFGAFYVLPRPVAVGFGMLASLLATIYSIRVLANLVAIERIPRLFQTLLIRLGFVRPRA